MVEEALERSRRAGDEWGAARAMHELGVSALYARDHERAEQLLEKARAEYRRLGDERRAAEASSGSAWPRTSEVRLPAPPSSSGRHSSRT